MLVLLSHICQKNAIQSNVRYSRKRADDEIEMSCPMMQETVHLKKDSEYRGC